MSQPAATDNPTPKTHSQPLAQPEPTVAPEVAAEPAPPTPSAPADPTDLNSLFDEPAPAKDKAATPDAMPKDDFSVPADDKAAPDIFDNTKTQSTPSKVSAADIELFSQIESSPGSEPGVDLLANRKWVDNTGKFEVVGRLVEVHPGTVRLLKDSGKFTTVPRSRLSPMDSEFVDHYGHLLTATASLK